MASALVFLLDLIDELDDHFGLADPDSAEAGGLLPLDAAASGGRPGR